MKVTEAIILAGGQGERLRPLTSDRPKPMIEVAGYPLLYHNIQWLKRYGIERIVISCGYCHEAIQNYFNSNSSSEVAILYSVEERPLGRGGGIKLASQLLSDKKAPVLVMNGDLLTDLSLTDLFDFHSNSTAPVTMVIVNLRSPYGIVRCDPEHYVSSFEEKPILPQWINAGIYMVDYDLLADFPNEGDHEEDLFPKLAQEHKLRAYNCASYWRTIDTAKDLADLSRETNILNKNFT